MKSLVVLFNPNTSFRATTEMVAIAQEAARNWAEVEGVTADFGAPIIVDEGDLDTARRAVDVFADRMDETNWPADGIVIGAFGDPGLPVLRLRAPVPVVGLGECAIAEASAEGRPFSIVTTTPELEASIRQQVETHGVCRQLRSIRITPGVPADVMADDDRLDRALARLVADVMAEDGSHNILVAGGPLSASARRLASQFSLPIIDPVTTALNRLGLLLRPAR